MAVPGFNNSISSRAPFGMAYALLQHDMTQRFLLHFFTLSAHSYTRGHWTPTGNSNLADRDEPAGTYTTTSVHAVPIYLKWMLVFEEPETRTLWLGKAVPRDWLAAGETPVSVQGATTRYGRVSFTMQATATAAASATTPHTVRVNVSVPSSWGGSAARKPAGGLCVRVRAPREHAGKMSGVTVGGQPWAGFDAATETVTFSAVQLAGGGVAEGLQDMVVSFGAATAVPLRRAKVDMSKRVLAKPDAAF